MSDPVTFKSLRVGTRFRFAATPYGKTYKKMGPNQYRVANHTHLFRAENETLVVALPDLPPEGPREFLPLGRAGRGRHVAVQSTDGQGEGA
ncbi:hypothetical protein OQ496_13415 [Acetobacter suratthaniensis]|uniref:Uncharacterized protein n=1 Tax=Acetobacter suratthaniensis TaxID=1502841 RepID=A0ABS3LQD3_9PROT|nr:hypothetical protein [Acetobacter suratthaniensis]MBO1329573.1 hypothetical protein [Acetobacter suratthaniensis]MCX2567446.1 hypothetical protein [Acetobacter suratthaniensis]